MYYYFFHYDTRIGTETGIIKLQQSRNYRYSAVNHEFEYFQFIGGGELQNMMYLIEKMFKY